MSEASNTPTRPLIREVRLAPTHDGEAALLVELIFPNGGVSTVQVEGQDAAAVMARANAKTASDLVGLPWTVLQVRDVSGPGSTF